MTLPSRQWFLLPMLCGFLQTQPLEGRNSGHGRGQAEKRTETRAPYLFERDDITATSLDQILQREANEFLVVTPSHGDALSWGPTTCRGPTLCERCRACAVNFKFADSKRLSRMAKISQDLAMFHFCFAAALVDARCRNGFSRHCSMQSS